MTCEAPPRPDKRWVEPDNLVVLDFTKKISWDEVKGLYPNLSPGEAMEQMMLAVLDNTWRTWIKGDGVFYRFETQRKKEGWRPNYWGLINPGVKPTHE